MIRSSNALPFSGGALPLQRLAGRRQTRRALVRARDNDLFVSEGRHKF
jgi:hypothetical protein